MKKLKVHLDPYQMEKLIYNDLDPMLGYPEHLHSNEEEVTLKKILKEELIPGEEVILRPESGYAVTNYGRVFTGKSRRGGREGTVIKVRFGRNNFYFSVNSTRFMLNEILEDFDYNTQMQRYKDLEYPLEKAYDWAKLD